jgi:predicted nucleic acid-binding protein
MNGKPFFATNVLIYAIAEGDPRAEVARALLSEGGAVSVHVLNEFVAAGRRKYRMSWKEIREALTAFRVLCPEPQAIDIETHEAALEIAERYGYGIYDSLVVAAAIQAGSSTLYSEDLQAGHKIKGLTIRNPFLSS